MLDGSSIPIGAIGVSISRISRESVGFSWCNFVVIWHYLMLAFFP